MFTHPLTSIDHLKALRARLLITQDDQTPVIVISAGTCGQASGANDIIQVTKRELLAKGLTTRIRLRVTGCHGFCQMEPSVLVEPHRTFYPRVGLKEMARIVEAVATGQILDDLLYADPATGARLARQEEVPFFAQQVRSILAQSERVDPMRIYTYVQAGG